MSLNYSFIFFLGQGIKDIVQWPRPGAPVFRLHNKWELEYGMPSTHAMVGVSIPFSVILFTMNRYLYNVPICILFAIGWCTVICLSRLYLGMHSVLVSINLFEPLSSYCSRNIGKPVESTSHLQNPQTC